MTDRSSPITPKEFYDLSGPELLDYCGADASKWARAFCRIKEAQGWSADDVDMSLMTTWFANAIEHSSQVRASLQPASPTACPTDDPSWPESQPCTVCGAFGPWFDTPQNGECASPASDAVAGDAKALDREALAGIIDPDCAAALITEREWCEKWGKDFDKFAYSYIMRWHRALAKADAILAALRSDAAGGVTSGAATTWEPLDMAPRDGRHVLIIRTPPYSATGNIVIAFWHDGRNTPAWVCAGSGLEIDTRIWNRWRHLPGEEYYPHAPRYVAPAQGLSPSGSPVGWGGHMPGAD
jgi:hypothetical protein